MRTNGVNRSEPQLSMFFEQTTGARNDLMPELFQLPDLRSVNRPSLTMLTLSSPFFIFFGPF
jgi:hypothetical protein